MSARLRVPTMALVLFAALAVEGRGRQLLEIDGIELRGTEQLVLSGGGTCNVLESDTSYEARKDNHGVPMDIWRLDFAVTNGSGRWLDHLIARFQIESAWPDCTNWDGPEAGQFPQSIEWAGSAGHIQESGRNAVAPGQTLTDTKFLIVLRGDPQPRFANWSMDFDFATVPPRAGPAGQGGSAAVPASQLPAEIQLDLHLRKAEQAVREGDAGTARAAMERIASLQAEHGLETAAGDQFRYAQAWAAAGEPQRAVAAAVRYLQAGGRDAEHYTEALDLINRDGALEPAAAARNAAGRSVPGATERTPTPAPRAGQARVFDGMEFAWIPAGEFLMGSASSQAYDSESPVTRVRISRGYWLGRHEVTQDQWQAVMGTNPSRFSGCGRCPVETVSWEDVQAFVRQLNGQAGGNRYRLPTEAEWEYAARAGTSGDRYGALDTIAWYRENSGDRTHPVGQKAQNAWGLHDMLGNVWEWVQDWHGDYPGGSVTDPRGPGAGSGRVRRGAGWADFARGCRAPFRYHGGPGLRRAVLGFRLLRTE